MTAPNLTPALSLFSALSAPPLRPLHTLFRTTEERFRPSCAVPYEPIAPRSDVRVAASPTVSRRASILRERGAGRMPTIVLGGLVPDATEQVFLLRRFLLRSGDVYYVQYPRASFSLDVICAQLDELVTELGDAGLPPVIFSVSFGSGVALEWMRRLRVSGRRPVLAGFVAISPVTCVADLIAPGAAKPKTLLGRALKPFLDVDRDTPDAVVEKSRQLFTRMFESGAQNTRALRILMTAAETRRLRDAVMATIRAVDVEGARQRTQALAAMAAPTEYFSPVLLPLDTAPALILFAEREDAVLDDAAPVRLAFERAPRAYFPQAVTRLITAAAGDAPVQHASLIFHVFEFLPSLQAFYQRLRRGPQALAA